MDNQFVTSNLSHYPH